jgi:hypothetical protein
MASMRKALCGLATRLSLTARPHPDFLVRRLLRFLQRLERRSVAKLSAMIKPMIWTRVLFQILVGVHDNPLPTSQLFELSFTSLIVPTACRPAGLSLLVSARGLDALA